MPFLLDTQKSADFPTSIRDPSKRVIDSTVSDRMFPFWNVLVLHVRFLLNAPWILRLPFMIPAAALKKRGKLTLVYVPIIGHAAGLILDPIFLLLSAGHIAFSAKLGARNYLG